MAKIIPAIAVRIPFLRTSDPLLNIQNDEIAIKSMIIPKVNENQ